MWLAATVTNPLHVTRNKNRQSLYFKFEQEEAHRPGHLKPAPLRVKLAEPKLNQVAESGVDELEEISHPGRKEVHLRARFNPERLTKFKRSLPVEVVGYDDRLVALGPSSRCNIWHPLFREGK